MILHKSNKILHIQQSLVCFIELPAKFAGQIMGQIRLTKNLSIVNASFKHGGVRQSVHTQFGLCLLCDLCMVGYFKFRSYKRPRAFPQRLNYYSHDKNLGSNSGPEAEHGLILM